MRRCAAAAAVLVCAAGPAAAFDFEPVVPLDTAQVDPALLKNMLGAWEIRVGCRVFAWLPPFGHYIASRRRYVTGVGSPDNIMGNHTSP